MNYTRIFTARDGGSQFHVVNTDFADLNYVASAPPLALSDPIAATEVRLMKAPAGWESDWHPSATRNLFIVLTGEWEVIAGNAEKRRFRTGDVLLVEDTSGKGHQSRVVSDVESVAVMVTLGSE